MDRFKLHVGEGCPNQHRQGMLSVGATVDELLQLAHAGLHLPRRRRHEAGFAGPGATDPVLAAPELPGQPIGSATPCQQPAVDLSQQAGGEGKALPQPRHTVLQPRYVTGDLDHVIEWDSRGFLQLKQQQI